MAYVDYTDDDGNTRIDEYSVGADGTFDRRLGATCCSTSTSRTPNHNGGDIAFGPDGMLYIGIGDGGSGGDPQRTG